MPKEWIAVALGGMLGALARHALSWVFSHLGPAWLPIATLVVNVLGCFAIGAIVQWALQQSISREWWVVGVRVGLLGGLTTFSSFALEVVWYLRENRSTHALILIGLHVVIGVAAVMAGIAFVSTDKVVADN